MKLIRKNKNLLFNKKKMVEFVNKVAIYLVSIFIIIELISGILRSIAQKEVI